MRAPLPLLMLVCGAAASTLRAQPSASAGGAAALFARLIADRTAVVTRADTAAYRRMVDRALVYVDDNGSRANVDQHIRDFLKRSDELAHQRWDIDSLHVYVRGALAFVEYRTLQHRPLGSREVISSYQVSESYVRRGNRWLLFRHAEAHALALPASRTLDTSVLDDYVGRYEWWPGYVDVISRRGNDLFNQATGDKEATLNQAATPEAFYIAGDPSLLVFLRDSTGRVVAYVLHEPDGQVTRARKVP
ncbi:MAG: nuclear transport factor 2 family protein [Gemmatimonadaceae bacterium]